MFLIDVLQGCFQFATRLTKAPHQPGISAAYILVFAVTGMLIAIVQRGYSEYVTIMASGRSTHICSRGIPEHHCTLLWHVLTVATNSQDCTKLLVACAWWFKEYM